MMWISKIFVSILCILLPLILPAEAGAISDHDITEMQTDKRQSLVEKLENAIFNQSTQEKGQMQITDKELQMHEKRSYFSLTKKDTNIGLDRQKRDKHKETTQKTSNDQMPRSMTFVKFEIGETIRLKCHIPNGPYLVMWNKVGVDYPLSIGTRRFVPDDRITVRFKSPDKWRLTITNAKLSDSGVYTCTTSEQKSEQNSPANKQASSDHREKWPGQVAHLTYRNDASSVIGHKEELSGSKDFENKDYYVTVVEPNPSDRFQVDAPATERVIKQNKSIVVTGPKIVFYGTPLELICRASFASSEAKLNPAISLEWYHRGVRRRPSRTRSGGVYISQRWLESNLLESRLLVAWASEADAGQWICLDRSNFPSSSRSAQPTSGNGQVQYQNRQSGYDRNSNSIHLASNTYDTKTKPSVTINGHTPSFVPASFKRFYDQDILFDRIEVEIVDLPDPTPEPQIAPVSQSMPAFVKLDKPETYAYEPAPSGYGKVEAPGILRSSSGSRMHSAAKLSQSSYEQRATTVSHSVLLMTILFRGFCF